MMFAVWSHANAIQLVRCKFKVSWVKLVVNSSDTNLVSAEKIFEYVKNLFCGSPSWNFLAPAVNFVTFMVQRPSANIALLRGSRLLLCEFSESMQSFKGQKVAMVIEVSLWLPWGPIYHSNNICSSCLLFQET